MMSISTSRSIGICIMFVALAVMYHNVRQSSSLTSDRYLVESSAHVVGASPLHKSNQELLQMTKYKHDETEFRAENLSQSNRVQCGFYKCFFGLKHTNDIGYLVSPADALKKQMGRKWQKTLDGTWHFAEYLKQKYDIENLLLGPATNTTVTAELESVLNTNLWVVGHGPSRRKTRYKEGSTIIIQKVKAAPQPNILFAVLGKKRRTFYKEISNFISSNVQSRRKFGRNFFKSMATARTIVNNEPCFAHDFQVLLDANGNFHHLDYERCLDYSIEYDLNHTLQVMDKVEEMVQQALGDTKSS